MAGGLGVALYALGIVAPDWLWGTHAAAFLPAPLAWLLIAIAGAMVLKGPMTVVLRLPSWHGKYAASGLVAGAAVYAAIVYALPMDGVVYGDAVHFAEELDSPKASQNLDEAWDMVLSPNVLHPRVGERTTLNLVRLMLGPGFTFRDGFRLLGALSALLFALFFLFFLRSQQLHTGGRWLMAAAALTAPACLVFYGHAEVYAPAMAAFMGAACAVTRTVQTRRVTWLAIAVLSWVVALKFHITAWVFAPALLIAVIRVLWPGQDPDERTRRATLWAVGGGVTTFAIVYFGVTGDMADPRTLGPDVRATERLFLPLWGTEAPHDRFNLFSPFHLWDFSNLVMLWAPPALLVLLAVGRGDGCWRRPDVAVTALGLAALGGLAFVMNPLLGMQMDWDLLSLATPWLLVLSAVALTAHPQANTLMPRLAGPMLALILCALPLFAIHTDRGALSQRLQALGVASFRGNWNMSAKLVDYAMQIGQLPADEAVARYHRVIKTLRPYAVLGKDTEYAHLFFRVGKYMELVRKDPESALQWYRTATKWGPAHSGSQLAAMDLETRGNDLDRAAERARLLVRLGRPSPQRALRAALHVSLLQGDVEAATQHANAYMQLMPKDGNIATVRSMLRAGRPVREVLGRFATPMKMP